MQIYGFAMTDLIYDIKQVNPDWFDVERPTKLPSFPNEFGENGNFWASVRQTRFGVRGWLPTGWGDVKTEFEFDLFGVDVGRRPDDDPPAPGLGLARATSSSARRTACSWTGTCSRTSSSTGVRTGWSSFRNVQLRWTPIDGDTKLIFALERPGASGDSGKYSDRIELQDIKGHFPYPDFTAQFHYGGAWGHVQLAGIVRYIGWTDTVQDAFDLSDHAIGWGLNLSSVIKSASRAT